MQNEKFDKDTQTLMIAESRPEDMEMMVKVVVNLMR